MALVQISSYEKEFGRTLQLPKCNRGACHNRFAPCYNRGTNTYYCVQCARDINYAPAWDGKPLCEIPEPGVLALMQIQFKNGEQYVGDKKLEDYPHIMKTGDTPWVPAEWADLPEDWE